MVVKFDDCVVQAASTYCYFAIYVFQKQYFLLGFRKFVRERRGAYMVLVGNQREKQCLEDLGPEGSIILIPIDNNWVGGGRGVGMDSIDLA
jgi:hypothetical protein